MAAQWGLGLGNNALSNFQFGVGLGQNLQDRRDQREQRNALLDIRRQEEARLGAAQQATQQQQTDAKRHEQLSFMSRLFDHATDETTYQQARAAAQQYGIDVSGAPPNYDPNWVGQQKMILQAVQTPEGQQALSDAGKKAQDAGYDINTREGQAVVRQIITAGLAQPYTGSQGETRLYTPDPFGGGQQGALPPETLPPDFNFEGGSGGNAAGNFR